MSRARARCAVAALVLGACGTHDLYLGGDLPGEAPPAGTAPAGSGGQRAPDAAAPVAVAPRDAATAPTLPPVDAGAAVTDSGPPAPADAGPPPCAAGLADCDGDPANGCEADLQSDPAHCGACGLACGFPDCGCQGGQPVLRCPAGTADCNGERSDGCETDVIADDTNCGGCGVTCPSIAFEAPRGASCVDGACVLMCEALHRDCDGDIATGCEVNIWRSDDNCGACGVVCPCLSGQCQ